MEGVIADGFGLAQRYRPAKIGQYFNRTGPLSRSQIGRSCMPIGMSQHLWNQPPRIVIASKDISIDVSYLLNI
jgi:hypothetical protein